MEITPLDPWICRKTGGVLKNASRAEIDVWQIDKFNETLNLARSRSVFYRDKLQHQPESIHAIKEISRLPFTTAEDIRRSPLQFLCVSQGEIQRVVTLQTSGTTGEPKRIFFTSDDQELTIDFFGVGMSTLVKPGERVLIFLPGARPGSVGDLLRLGLERLGMTAIPYGAVSDPLHALETLHNHQADCLVGSPTQVLGLARRWRPSMHKPHSVLLSTDYVPAAIVKILEDIWGCEVFNHYGTTEMGLGGGVECTAHRGYHLREADLLFEVIDPLSGEVLPDGEYGEVVFSTLTRGGMPLIRYRTGDRSRFLPGTCPCGTDLKTLEKVTGRFDGFIHAAETPITLPEIDEVLFPVEGLLDFIAVMSENALVVEARMLDRVGSQQVIEQALHSIPALKNLNVIVHCQHSPGEAGSLKKRVIIDTRGQHA